MGDRSGAVAQEVVHAERLLVGHPAGDGENLAPELEGEPGGDQRAGAGRRFDHDGDLGQGGDDPVAHREVRRRGRQGAGKLAHQRSPVADAQTEVAMSFRVVEGESASEDAHRPPVLGG